MTECRGSATKARLESVKKQEEEEANRLASGFKAQPVPNYHAMNVQSTPKREPKELTEPVPFNLNSTQMHEVAQAELQEKIELEETERNLLASATKANPIPSTTYKPDFTPNKPSETGRTPLKGISPDLVTKSQAKNRAEYDKVNKTRMDDILQEKTLLHERKEAEEQEELNEKRRMPVSEGGMMVEAKPIITDDQFPVTKVEEKILTEPVFSPSELRVSLRAEMR